MPNKMPNDILKSKKLKIGFDPRLFKKGRCKKSLIKIIVNLSQLVQILLTKFGKEK